LHFDLHIDLIDFYWFILIAFDLYWFVGWQMRVQNPFETLSWACSLKGEVEVTQRWDYCRWSANPAASNLGHLLLKSHGCWISSPSVRAPKCVEISKSSNTAKNKSVTNWVIALTSSLNRWIPRYRCL
jgi:hypothetical protein